jgi:apolipoprotein N-acyltransferase
VGIVAAGILAAAWPAEAGRSLSVAVVQPDTPSSRRHGADVLDPNLRVLLALSEEAVAGGPDLLVWPETAWDGTAARGGDRFLGVVARALATPLVAGARGRGPRGLRNAAVLARPTGEVRRVAAKRHPVPVYEGAPRGPLARTLARRGLWPGRVVVGAPPAPFALGEAAPATRLGALICFDLHDARLVRRLRRAGAGMLLVLANEADLGPSSAAAGERLARLRAAEHRIAVVRVANNGPSLWIDGRGRVVAALGPGRAAAGRAVVAIAAPPPFYSRAGAGPALAAFVPLAALGLAGAPRVRAPRLVPPGSPALPIARRSS